jgi:hypothetical protein
VKAEVKAHFAKKKPEPKLFIPPGTVKHFAETRAQPPHLPSDYARSIVRAKKQPRSGKSIPQLGEQKIQSVPPLKVYSYDDPETKYLVTKLGKDLDMEVQYEDYYPTAEIAYSYKYGKPLVRPDQLPKLQTQMRRLHDWYMQSCREGSIMLVVAVRDEHYFRGDDEIHVDFSELFQLYKNDALDKSLISCYCL